MLESHLDEFIRIEVPGAGVTILDPGELLLECADCGSRWRARVQRGTQSPPSYWKCPNDCNLSVEDTRVQSVVCEACSCKFVYRVNHLVRGNARRTEGRTKLRLAASAGGLPREPSIREQHPIFCPGCGLYQSDMLPKVKKEQFRWMTGWISLLTLLEIPAVVGVALAVAHRFDSEWVEIGSACAALMALIAVNIVLLRSLLIHFYDPNTLRRRANRIAAWPPQVIPWGRAKKQ